MRSCESGDSGSAHGQAFVLLMVALVSLLLAACFGGGGDGDDWEEETEIETSKAVALASPLPLDRDGSYDGVFLVLSEGWADVLGLGREIAFNSSSIRFSLTISTGSREWCDRGEMAIRDDVAGERHVFVQDGDCVKKLGDIAIRGVFEEDVPISAEGVTTPADS